MIKTLLICAFVLLMSKQKQKKTVDVELLILLKYSFYFDSMTNLRLSRQSEGMVSAGRHPHHLLVVQTLDAERLQSAKTHNTLYIRVNDMLCKHRRESTVKTTANKRCQA